MLNQITKMLATLVLLSLTFNFMYTQAGANPQPINNTPTQKVEATQTEQNQKRLSTIVPPPELQDSIERRNLVERLKRNNKADKIGYVFLLSDNGSVITNYTIKGKVSSLNSLLTTPQQSLPDSWCSMTKSTGSSCQSLVVDSPDFDGSYGKNPDGVFFFTTDGNMIEWTGKYLYSEQPMNLSTAPVLTYNITK
jgi:hypothetical protein